MHYWDTSTLGKLYVSEADSPKFTTHLTATGPATTFELARWGMFRAFARKEADQVSATGAAEAVFARFEVDVASGRVTPLPMSAAIEERFRKLALTLHRLTPPVFTRTLDAIYLATAELHQAGDLLDRARPSNRSLLCPRHRWQDLAQQSHHRRLHRRGRSWPGLESRVLTKAYAGKPVKPE